MKRERIFTRLHTVKLRLLSNKAMKISEAVLLMILSCKHCFECICGDRKCDLTHRRPCQT